MRWQELPEAVDGSEIEIRGFLYQTPSGSWILSSEAGLKTCCQGHPEKKGSQLTLVGNFSEAPTNKRILVVGKIDQLKGQRLLEGSWLPESPFPWGTAGLLALCLLLLALYREIRSRNGSKLKR